MTSAPLTFSLPLHVDLPRKKGKPKRVHCSLNVYRNTHHHIANDVKHAYKGIVWGQLDELETAVMLVTPVEVTVTMYAPDKRARDIGNFCSLAQKYADDAVVEYGLLPDDSVKFIKRATYIYGGVDSDNPRFEIAYSPL